MLRVRLFIRSGISTFLKMIMIVMMMLMRIRSIHITLMITKKKMILKLILIYNENPLPI